MFPVTGISGERNIKNIHRIMNHTEGKEEERKWRFLRVQV
jgi:hypothetical protein